MKAKVLVCVLAALLCAGCEEPLAAISGTAVIVALDRSNKALVRANEAAEALNARAEEMEAVIKNNPLAVVGYFDPNLQTEVEKAVTDAKNIVANAKDEEGKFDWWKAGTALAILLTGGTGVNLYKNRKKAS